MSSHIPLMALRTVLLGCLCGAFGCGEAATNEVPTGGRDDAVLFGEETRREMMRGTVALLDRAGRFVFCTGTLIAPDVVITAAHCLLTLDDEGRVEGARTTASYVVLAGASSVATSRPEFEYDVARARAHPDFLRNPPTDAARAFDGLHDIGVLLLTQDVDTLEPVPVLGARKAVDALQVGNDLIIEGYGSSDTRGEAGSGVLRWARVPVVRLGEDELIAGDGGTADTCPGDSGGPVYVEQGGRLWLAGVTSRAVARTSTLCGEGGIYTLAYAHFDFVRELAPNSVPDAAEDIKPSTTPESGGNEGTNAQAMAASGERDVDGPESRRESTERAFGCVVHVSGPSDVLAWAGLGLLAVMRRRYTRAR